MKNLNKILIIFLSVTLVGILLYWLISKRIDFNFANEGKIICVDHRDWGIASSGDITCFNISQIGVEQPTLRYNCKTLNDEIILTK
jgi:hypothetical protein